MTFNQKNGSSLTFPSALEVFMEAGIKLGAALVRVKGVLGASVHVLWD